MLEDLRDTVEAANYEIAARRPGDHRRVGDGHGRLGLPPGLHRHGQPGDQGQVAFASGTAKAARRLRGRRSSNGSGGGAVFRRVLWFTTGATAGFGGAMWIRHQVLRTVRRYAPERVQDDVTSSVRRSGPTCGTP